VTKLERLAQIEGFTDTMELLEANIIDSVVPGICTNEDCDYTCEVEPDQQSGWCEDCNEGTVSSCLILGGVI
jgi:hypothetical protein